MADDYPAAHSMDTLWFAVDRDGCVASFYSGEAGAVPQEALLEEDTHAALASLTARLPAGEAVRDPTTRRLPGSDIGNPMRERAWTGQFPVLLFLTSLDPVRDALASGLAQQLPVTEGFAVLFRSLDEPALGRYVNLPECVSSCNVFSRDGDDPSLARYGFYEYQHMTENWISGPYAREAIPRRPLHIDELPPNLRRLVGQMRFDLRFADTPHLQPIEHAECESWEAAYLDVTGRHIRPIPGKEQEYAEVYEERYTDEDRFQVEPPK